MAKTIYYVYVVDQEDHLAGVISLRDLIVSSDDTLIVDTLNERVISVHVGSGQENVAQTVRDYDLLAVPVTDYDDYLSGIVTVDDTIDVINDKAASDYSGLAGVDAEEVDENLLKAASKRLPRSITLLFLGMSTASSISNYGSLVSEAGILAVFIPLTTGTAGDTGTRSLAIAVRRSVMKDEKGSNFGRLILGEAFTGLVTGAVIGLTIMIVVGVRQHNLPPGFVIGMVMLCAITVTDLVGSLVPMLMDKLGLDPAVASDPSITTLSDLTSVLAHFNITSMFMRYFV